MAGDSLVERLMKQAERHVGAGSPARIHILVGALSNISPVSLRRQFTRTTVGSPLAGVELVFHVGGDPLSPDALAVRVVEVDVAA